MTEAEAIASITDLAGMALAFVSLWFSATFGYLTVAYFLGNVLSRFQCSAVSALYGFSAFLFIAGTAVYTKATELMIGRERTIFDQLYVDSLAWAESISALSVCGTLLSFYFMYNVRQRSET